MCITHTVRRREGTVNTEMCAYLEMNANIETTKVE